MDVDELVSAIVVAAPKLRAAGVTKIAVDPSGRWEVEIAPEPHPPTEPDLSALATPTGSQLSAAVDAKTCVECGVRPRRYGDRCRACVRSEVIRA